MHFIFKLFIYDFLFLLVLAHLRPRHTVECGRGLHLSSGGPYAYLHEVSYFRFSYLNCVLILFFFFQLGPDPSVMAWRWHHQEGCAHFHEDHSADMEMWEAMWSVWVGRLVDKIIKYLLRHQIIFAAPRRPAIYFVDSGCPVIFVNSHASEYSAKFSIGSIGLFRQYS